MLRRPVSVTLPDSVAGHPHADAMRSMLDGALAAVAPEACIERHLRREGDTLAIGDRRYDLARFRRVRIFGAGKASVGLTRAVLDRLGDVEVDGLVIAKHGADEDLGAVRLRTAAHPTPDASSLEATRELIDLLGDSNEDDLVLCPISGGASSLMTQPDEMSLEELSARTAELIRSGATIQVINERRRAWDRIKGGGLAAAAGPAEVVGLVLSDVVGDPLRYIGSGPTVPDRPDDRIHNVIVGRNADAIEGARLAGERLGLQIGLHRDPLVGEAREVGVQVARILARAGDGFPVAAPGCLLLGGETTVTVVGNGRGGRNQELALAAVRRLHGTDVVLVTLATDGEDGPTPAAGAVATGQTQSRAQAAGLVPAAALSANDSHGFFDALGDIITTGPTGTNVGDLVLGFVF